MYGELRAVPGYEGLYSVDAYGNVYSHESRRYIPQSDPLRTNGRICVCLYRGGDPLMFNLADLVAAAFVPNPNNFRSVKHKNGNRKNCRASNLEWVA